MSARLDGTNERDDAPTYDELWEANEWLRLKAGKLQERLNILEEHIENGTSWPCPVCGGETSSSTKFPKRYCLQRFGHCGEWVLPPVGSKKNRPANTTSWPQTYFHRTTIDEMDRVIPNDRMIYKPVGHIFFKRGRAVSPEQYFESVDVAAERDEEEE